MIAGMLLAAGGGRRFGSQKLVATLDGVPLVRRAADTLASVTDSLTVIVGSQAPQVHDAVRGMSVTVIENENWETGMASSLAAGVRAVPSEAQAIVVALGDQPGLDVIVIRRVIDMWRETRKPIVVTQYADNRGHPVLFDRSMFHELVALTGDQGAKSLIARSTDRVAVVQVAAPAPRDVDTEEDLRTWTA